MSYKLRFPSFSIKITSYELQHQKLKLRVTTSKAQVTSYNIKSTSYELQRQQHKLRVTTPKAQVTSYNITRYELRHYIVMHLIKDGSLIEDAPNLKSQFPCKELEVMKKRNSH